jgi:hypothetical protein
VHLDNDDLNADDLAYLELPTDEEAAESAAEQRVLMASFETQRRNESAQHLMAGERKAAADELAVSHQSARQSARRRNLAAVDEARAAENRATVAAERRLQAERARAAELRGCANTNTPCPPTTSTLALQKMPNAADSSCGKHASAVAWRQAIMAVPAPTSSG